MSSNKLNSVNNGKILLLKTTTRLVETVSGRLLLRRDGNNSLRKHPTFRDASTDFPANWRRNERRNSILMTRHYPDLVSTSDWSCREENLLRPTICTYQIWQWRFISMEFLRLFLRRHFAGKSVVASRNVSCFLRLEWQWNLKKLKKNHQKYIMVCDPWSD